MNWIACVKIEAVGKSKEHGGQVFILDRRQRDTNLLIIESAEACFENRNCDPWKDQLDEAIAEALGT